MKEVLDDKGCVIDIEIEKNDTCWFYDDSRYSNPILSVYSHKKDDKHYPKGIETGFDKVEVFIGMLPDCLRFKKGKYE